MRLPLWYLCSVSFKAMRDIGKAYSVCKVFPAPEMIISFRAGIFVFQDTVFTEEKRQK